MNKNILKIISYFKGNSTQIKNHNLYIGKNSFLVHSKTGAYTTIKNDCIISNCEIGDYTYISHESHFNMTKIGKFCSIGQNVRCGLGKHPTNFISTHPMFFSTGKQCQITFSDNNYYKEREEINIGNDVWIGTNVTILDGVTIGHGAIIGTCSLITKDVPPYAIVGGVPAKIIKYRFSEEVIESLLKSKWWDKDITILKENYKDFHDVDTFLHNIKLNSC